MTRLTTAALAEIRARARKGVDHVTRAAVALTNDIAMRFDGERLDRMEHSLVAMAGVAGDIAADVESLLAEVARLSGLVEQQRRALELVRPFVDGETAEVRDAVIAALAAWEQP